MKKKNFIRQTFTPLGVAVMVGMAVSFIAGVAMAFYTLSIRGLV